MGGCRIQAGLAMGEGLRVPKCRHLRAASDTSSSAELQTYVEVDECARRWVGRLEAESGGQRGDGTGGDEEEDDKRGF